jgi:hypothetical protein
MSKIARSSTMLPLRSAEFGFNLWTMPRFEIEPAAMPDAALQYSSTRKPIIVLLFGKERSCAAPPGSIALTSIYMQKVNGIIKMVRQLTLNIFHPTKNSEVCYGWVMYCGDVTKCSSALKHHYTSRGAERNLATLVLLLI